MMEGGFSDATDFTGNSTTGFGPAKVPPFAKGLPNLVGGAVFLAVGETVILLHPPLPVAGVSIGMERECQQNDG